MKIKGNELGEYLAESKAINRYSLLTSILKINPRIETVCNSIIVFRDFGGRIEFKTRISVDITVFYNGEDLCVYINDDDVIIKDDNDPNYKDDIDVVVQTIASYIDWNEPIYITDVGTCQHLLVDAIQEQKLDDDKLLTWALNKEYIAVVSRILNSCAAPYRKHELIEWLSTYGLMPLR